MKDVIKVGLFLAVEEPSWKTTKALGKVVEKVLNKYEPQITKIVDAVTDHTITELDKDKEEKK